MSPHCSWLFGRGASIANALSWVVPDEWNRDRVTREVQIDMITDAIRKEILALEQQLEEERKQVEKLENEEVAAELANRGH